MGLEVEQKIAVLWKSSATAALQGGADGQKAVDYADEVCFAFEARFSSVEGRSGVTITLPTALRHYERSSLIGKEVILLDHTDLPPIGKIKDFSEGGKVFADQVLIRWESSKPATDEENWVPVGKVALLNPWK